MYYETGPMESWQVFYLLLMASTIPPLVGAIVADLVRHGLPLQKMPTWFWMLGALGMLMALTPAGWVTMLSFLVVFTSEAPLAPGLFGAVFVLGAWALSLAGIFNLPSLWRTMSPRM